MPGLWKPGTYRDTVIRRITDVPVVGRPLRLRVRMSRYRCTTTSCGREVFAHSTDRLARRGATFLRGAAPAASWAG
jgi:transposase